jgi:uracil-DNA glycosylase family 4
VSETSGASFAGRKHAEADCDGCTLYRSKHVPNHLPEGATLAFIGEAPGRMETQGGRPFVGPSGRLLHNTARAVGIDLEQVAEFNVIRCQPPANRTPTQGEINRCKPALLADLATLPIETVVTLGNTATRAITGLEKITQARIGPPREMNGWKVIPTFHPAACLRQGDNYPSMARDLKKVYEPPSQWKAPSYTVLDDYPSAMTYLTHVLTFGSAPIVVDIEVGIEKDTDFEHPERYQFLCVGFVFHGQVTIIGEEALRFKDVQDQIWMVIHHHKPICHNGKFDLAGLSVFGSVAKLYFDTMLASHIMDERRGTNSLEFNAVEILGSPAWKAELDQYLGPEKNYAAIPRDVLYRYNSYDIWNTWLLYNYFCDHLTWKERELHDWMCRVSDMFMHTEMAGSRIDPEYLRQLGEELKLEMAEYEEITSKYVDNPRSWQQVQRALDELGHPTKSTDELHLTMLMRQKRMKPSTREFLQALLKYRGVQKLHSTYVEGLLKRAYNDRIHTSILLHGTTTGRASSRNPNIHNQPRGYRIRRAWIPDSDEYVYVQADYRTAELRVMGIEADCSYLIPVLSDPERDIHNEVSDVVYGVGNWRKDVERVRTKAVVFGTSYGREPQSIADEYGISVAAASAIQDGFTDMMPDVVAWKAELKRRVFQDGWDPITHFGRTRHFHLITRDNAADVERQLYAFFPQSTANEICYRAATRIWEKFGFDIRILVHDSILVQTKPDEAKDIGEVMAREMEATALEEYSDKIPFFVDVQVGTNWGELA